MTLPAQPVNAPTETALPEVLLATKLYIPPPRPRSVARRRLVERLNSGMQHNPGVTFISAPPGFGKTTLLSEWVSQTSGPNQPTRPVGWVSLDEDDNSPRRFLAYGLAALQKIHPTIGLDALNRIGDHTLTPETFLTPLINEMMGITKPFIFVLDDYHVIETPLIHEGLAFILNNLPPQGQLVIASRMDLPISLARLRARGQLTELTVEDLAFTPTETAEFLNQTMGLELSPREIEALETRTEGWIAGLQMAALSMQGVQDTAGFVRTFTGSHRFILDYLLEEVLNRQSETIQNFLLHTSILNRLTGPLCDTLLQNNSPPPQPAQSPISNYQLPPSQAVLKQLDQANLFIIPLDDERRWYRYHHLFADLLRTRLSQRLDEAAVAELHQRASDWFHQHGFAAEAMSHALAAVDTQRIVTLAREKAATLVSHGEFIAMLSWLEHLPPEMTRSWSRVPLLPIWAMVLTGEVDTIEPRLQELEQQFNFDNDHDHMSGEITAIRAFTAYFRRDMPQAIDLCREALDQLPASNPFLRGVLIQSLGAALAWCGLTTQAAAAFVEASTLNRLIGNWEATLMAEWSLASAQAEQGYLKQAIETYRQTLALATSEATREVAKNSPYPGRTYLGLAEIFYQQNQLSEARLHLETGLAELSAGGDDGMLASGALIAARLKQAQGDHTDALEAIRRAEKLARQHHGPFYWSGQITTYHVQLWLVEKKFEAVKAWLNSRGLWPVTTPKSVPYLRESEYLLQTRFVLAQINAATAHKGYSVKAALPIIGHTLDRILTTAKENGRTGRAIETLVLLALVYHAQNKTGAALATLADALSLAAPEGFVRIFIDAGEPMADLLRQFSAARSATPYRTYANKLLAIFETAGASPPPLLDSLSERELEILRLTATGLSNKQLAENLVLTVGTVKWHLNNIYSKLGVNSRTEAVARAREVGLLS